MEASIKLNFERRKKSKEWEWLAMDSPEVLSNHQPWHTTHWIFTAGTSRTHLPSRDRKQKEPAWPRNDLSCMNWVWISWIQLHMELRLLYLYWISFSYTYDDSFEELKKKIFPVIQPGYKSTPSTLNKIKGTKKNVTNSRMW